MNECLGILSLGGKSLGRGGSIFIIPNPDSEPVVKVADTESLFMALEAIYYLTVIFGLPLAVFEYLRVKRKEKQDRDYETYNSLDEKYLEFQQLCLSHPYLDIFDVPDANPVQLDERQKKEELIAYTMLMSVFERAYLMYHGTSRKMRKSQWSEWHDYIRSYCARANFRAAWEKSGNTFHTDYQNYMERLMSGIATNA